jgi:hypothetical protein
VPSLRALPGETPTVTGGPLGSFVYKLAKIRAHYGVDDHSGSEHSIDGRHFAAEFQLVLINDKHASFAAAENAFFAAYAQGSATPAYGGAAAATATDEHDIVVISVMADVRGGDNKAVQSLFLDSYNQWFYR